MKQILYEDNNNAKYLTISSKKSPTSISGR